MDYVSFALSLSGVHILLDAIPRHVCDCLSTISRMSPEILEIVIL